MQDCAGFVHDVANGASYASGGIGYVTSQFDPSQVDQMHDAVIDFSSRLLTDKAVDKVTTIYDLHATILHLMGLDHTRLTYRFGGSWGLPRLF